jgi:hypothetical protein
VSNRTFSIYSGAVLYAAVAPKSASLTKGAAEVRRSSLSQLALRLRLQVLLKVRQAVESSLRPRVFMSGDVLTRRQGTCFGRVGGQEVRTDRQRNKLRIRCSGDDATVSCTRGSVAWGTG